MRTNGHYMITYQQRFTHDKEKVTYILSEQVSIITSHKRGQKVTAESHDY